MKKICAFVLAAVLVCALLSGCGGDRMDDGIAMPSGSPIIDPSMTPNIEDGIVNDRDGFIEDNEDGLAGDANGILNGNDSGLMDGSAGTGSAGLGTGANNGVENDATTGNAYGGTGSTTASPSPSAGMNR